MWGCGAVVKTNCGQVKTLAARRALGVLGATAGAPLIVRQLSPCSSCFLTEPPEGWSVAKAEVF